MTLPDRAAVLVAGLGPAGAATAIRLARAGHEVLAIDRAAFPRDKPCSEYMSPETLRQLDRLGLLAAVERAGGSALHGARVIGPRGSELTGAFVRAGVTPFRPTGLSLARQVLDAILVDAARAAGVRVVERARLRDLRIDRGTVRGAVIERDGRLHAVATRLVVGADGLHSVTARIVGRRRHGAPARYGFVAHVEGVAGLTGSAELHVGEQGYVGLNAIGGGLVNVAVIVPARLARAATGDATAFFQRAVASYPALRDRIPPNRLARRVLVTGPFAAWSGRVATRGAVLVGDAADFFDPFTGEGICAALRGAGLVADLALEAGLDPADPEPIELAGYGAARRRAFLGKWVVERMIGYGMLAPSLFDRAVSRLERRGLSHTLIGVTGEFVPARQVLRPGFLAAMVL